MRVTRSTAAESQGSSDQVVQRDFEHAAAAAVLPVVGVLGAYYLALVLLHPVTAPSSTARIVAVVGTVAAVAAVAAALIAWRRPVSLASGHPLMSLLAVVAATLCSWHLVQTGERSESLALVFVVVAAGGTLMFRRWLIPTWILVWGIGAFGAVRVGGDLSSWRDWIVGMVAATALGLAINIGRRSTIEHSADAVRQAERVATEDPLTGLLNRRGLALLGREIVGVAQRTGEATHATFLDIDGLKGINDALGHDVGDNIILSVAEAARASVRGTDIVARWGGDQFVIVGLGAGTSLEEMHSRLRSYFEDTFPLDIVLQGVSLSSGRAVLAPWDLGDLSSLVEKADLDLYERREARGQRSLVDFQPGDPQFRLEP